MWALRVGARTRDLLAAIWAQDDLTHHPYCEQAALMRLMGSTIEPPFVKRDNEWDDATAYLSEEWNDISDTWIEHVRIRHRAGRAYPPCRFDMRMDAPKINGRLPRYWVGQFERRVLRPRGIRVYDRKLKARSASPASTVEPSDWPAAHSAGHVSCSVSNVIR